MPKKLTREEFIKKAVAVHGDKYDYRDVEYINNATKVKIFCKKCGTCFEHEPVWHLSGMGCPKCAKNAKLTLDSFLNKAKNIHGNRYNYDLIKQVKSNLKVKILCNNCKKYFLRKISDHLSGVGCPYCTKSRNEIFINAWLTNNKIDFIPQKKFIDCKDKLPLPFDFYLPKFNTCIEFQGQQHFSSGLAFFINKLKSKDKAEEAFKRLIKHDKIKKKYCKDKNIKFIEITYKDKKDKIESLLKNIITQKD